MAKAIGKRLGGISYLHRSGDGPTLVLLHGIGSNSGSFEPIFDVLPSHLNVIAWNAPGYGGSDRVAATWPQASDYAEVLARFLDGLEVGEVFLMGHSLGALIAAAFARAFPDRVKAIVLASAANGYSVVRGEDVPGKVAARIEDLERLGPRAFARARAANLIHDPDQHPDMVARVEDAMAQVDPVGYAQAVRLLASGDLAGMIGAVKVQPGFVIGAEDRVTPIAQTEAAASAWEKAHGQRPRVIEIAEAGHAVYIQRPEEFVKALLEHFGMEEPSTCAAPEPNYQGA